ncbi:Uncharacterised protein [Streptococcus pneumoniae]|nr:Uncharacterised protein [Streptococcus pneumoniae]
MATITNALNIAATVAEVFSLGGAIVMWFRYRRR